MNDFIALRCLSCGGKLKITSDLEQFACTYCGNEFIVKRGEGTISLAPLVSQMKEIKNGVNKTAAELAIKRIQSNISSLQNNYSICFQTRTRLLKNSLMWGLVTLIAMYLLILYIKNTSISVGLPIGIFILFPGLLTFIPFSKISPLSDRISILKMEIQKCQAELEKYLMIVNIVKGK